MSLFPIFSNVQLPEELWLPVNEQSILTGSQAPPVITHPKIRRLAPTRSRRANASLFIDLLLSQGFYPYREAVPPKLLKTYRRSTIMKGMLVLLLVAALFSLGCTAAERVGLVQNGTDLQGIFSSNPTQPGAVGCWTTGGGKFEINPDNTVGVYMLNPYTGEDTVWFKGRWVDSGNNTITVMHQAGNEVITDTYRYMPDTDSMQVVFSYATLTAYRCD
jgi:hypothetical protein